jgi:2-iminobutanoate/2-iminopropanoate deaminase
MIRFAALLAFLSGASLVETDDFVYVSAITGGNANEVLAELTNRLKSVGLGLRQVASANLYLTDTAALPEAEASWHRVFPDDSPARTVLLATLPNKSTVSVSAIASRKPLRKIAGGGILTAGTLFLPGLLPRDGKSGIDVQTRDVMNQQESILKAAGLTFADLTLTRIYLSEPEDYSGLNEAYKQFVTAAPPARATVYARPLSAGQRIQIQSVAVQGSGKERPSGAGITTPIHSYSVRAGNRLYITGMTGRRPNGSFDKNDAGAQARVSIAAIEEQLRRNQMRFDDVVDTMIWLRDPSDWAAVSQVYKALIRQREPALTVVGIPPNSPDALVEIMMLAVTGLHPDRRRPPRSAAASRPRSDGR